jgi:isocitrate/isopropylmalate dehydrogenase
VRRKSIRRYYRISLEYSEEEIARIAHLAFKSAQKKRKKGNNGYGKALY